MSYTAPYGQMYLPMSDEWIPTLSATTVQPGVYAEIWTGLQLPNSEVANELILSNIPVISGSVTIDRNNTVRRTATNITLQPGVSAMLLPLVNAEQVTDANIYAPYSAEMRIYKGLNEGTEADPSYEFACLGVFQITDVAINDDASGCLLQGTMSDRASWVQAREFQIPYSTNGTDTVDLIITDILNVACIGMSGLPFPTNIPSGSAFVPAVVSFDVGDDPWEGVTDLASAAGMQMYFDYDGVCQFVEIPDPEEGDVCINYLEGTTPSSITIKRVLSNQSAPNIICVQSQGSNAATQFQVWWWDSNEYSPTYYADAPDGFSSPQTSLPLQAASARYPANVLVMSTSDIASADQGINCQIMANNAALLQRGIVEQTTFALRFNSAHDVDDLIEVQRITSGIYLNMDDTPTPINYVLDSITIDLAATANISATGRPVTFYGD